MRDERGWSAPSFSGLLARETVRWGRSNTPSQADTTVFFPHLDNHQDAGAKSEAVKKKTTWDSFLDYICVKRDGDLAKGIQVSCARSF